MLITEELVASYTAQAVITTHRHLGCLKLSLRERTDIKLFNTDGRYTREPASCRAQSPETRVTCSIQYVLDYSLQVLVALVYTKRKEPPFRHSPKLDCSGPNRRHVQQRLPLNLHLCRACEVA